MKNNAKVFLILILALVLGLGAIPAFAEPYGASENAVELIARFENCILTAPKDTAGVWTVGYGHTRNVTANTVLANEAEARALLREDLVSYADAVNRLAAQSYIRFELNQNRVDALVSFAFNCGTGNLQKLVKGRTAEEVAQQILGYNRGGGKILPILTQRRQAERELFLK